MYTVHLEFVPVFVRVSKGNLIWPWANEEYTDAFDLHWKRTKEMLSSQMSVAVSIVLVYSAAF